MRDNQLQLVKVFESRGIVAVQNGPQAKVTTLDCERCLDSSRAIIVPEGWQIESMRKRSFSTASKSARMW